MVQRKWLALPESTDRLVLLSYADGPPRFANLARAHADGSEVWVGERTGPLLVRHKVHTLG